MNLEPATYIVFEGDRRIGAGGLREVARAANKVQIKDAVQRLFKVSVTDVNTMILRGKDRRMGRGYSKTQNWKKAIVTLKEGDSIDFFAETSEPS